MHNTINTKYKALRNNSINSINMNKTIKAMRSAGGFRRPLRSLTRKASTKGERRGEKGPRF